MINLWMIALSVLILNLPFGFRRAGYKKYSLKWFLAIHLPVPFVIGLRYMTGIGWGFPTFPVMVGAYFAGQYLGGKICKRV